MSRDVVYYWSGGRVTGEWRTSAPGTANALRRAGYVAHPGLLAIGPPEGAPSENEFRAVGV